MFEISREQFQQKGNKLVFRHGSKQILLLGVDEKIFALDNRCPHEGYPLSEGTSDSKSCLLTCNWHNWKFDLTNGKCVMGADNVATYPVTINGDKIVVDLSEPTPEQIRDNIMDGFAEAFEKNQKGRISRELARLHYNDANPLYAVIQSIKWSHDKFEYGMNHSYAALADWLTLYFEENGLEEKLICLSEGIGYMAQSALRHRIYSFACKSATYTPEALINAVESENTVLAESLVAAGFAQGMTFQNFEQLFAEMALEHYNDFGHSLIYVYKASQVSQHLNNREVDQALALSLIRSLTYTTREDLIPEFKTYAPSLERLKHFSDSGDVDTRNLMGQRVEGACSWLVDQGSKHHPMALYKALLKLNGDNFLRYDLKYQDATHCPVTQNVGWLSYTHGITFANAVRILCTKYPHLWNKGLLQMACFYGRNTPYLDETISFDDWKVGSADDFFVQIKTRLYDHGIGQPIITAHFIKTALAIREEYYETGEELLLASFNRFINSPLKQAHIRRNVYQAINLVKKDFV